MEADTEEQRRNWNVESEEKGVCGSGKGVFLPQCATRTRLRYIVASLGHTLVCLGEENGGGECTRLHSCLIERGSDRQPPTFQDKSWVNVVVREGRYWSERVGLDHIVFLSDGFGINDLASHTQQTRRCGVGCESGILRVRDGKDDFAWAHSATHLPNNFL